MLHVTVCIITFRRQAWLGRLLDALRVQGHDGGPEYKLAVIVVDNDVEESARHVAESFACKGDFDLLYKVEPRQGIPIARNAALDAVPPDADFICFLDDDEWPSKNWLTELLRVQAATGATCVWAPVDPCFPADAPAWIIKSGIFAPSKFLNGARIKYAGTNNVLFSATFLRETGLRFDERLRYWGGDDHLFFYKAGKLGLRIHWAEKAVVYEEIPANRLTWAWMLQRQYKVGNTYAVSERLIGTPRELISRFFAGLARMALGIVMLPLWAFGAHNGLRAIRHVVRGAGMLGGLFGNYYEEYLPKKVLKDRLS